MIQTAFQQKLCSFADEQRDRLLSIVQDLVRIPSQNTAPTGEEEACQRYVAGFLRQQGWVPELYSLDEVPGLKQHPLFWPGRDYQRRPNVGARRRGTRTGRSLLLSGHIDTVPKGTQPWTRDPFGGQIEGNRLYGRGSNDMKGGVATNLFVVEALERLGIRLAGDLVFETVVDEEFGGSNGTLAGRLQGFNADAAVLSEPTSLRVCPAQQGGRVVHITLQAPGGILTKNPFPAGVISKLRHFLNHLEHFAAQRRRQVLVHDLYADQTDPVPVSITRVFTGPWGTREPTTIPEECRLEMYWQMMPGEKQEDVDREFFIWLDAMAKAAPQLFRAVPKVEFPIRWLPGSAISKSEPLIKELSECAHAVAGKEPAIVGLEAPCDLYVFQQGFGIPAVLWGARGGNTHAADEYLEIDSVIDAAKTLLVFVCQWCGVIQQRAC
ncbi:MAG: M20/M25/M40 family metallo-hydrolase [Acidobacteria bacterium]|nr:M20/M25/M40 family metallo-hydrolase [Acidobacteriota bacterium]MCI0720543.1 M20/M25/M40 family metallo-hydrolase [Acidobacteriota bacterium]